MYRIFSSRNNEHFAKVLLDVFNNGFVLSHIYGNLRNIIAH